MGCCLHIRLPLIFLLYMKNFNSTHLVTFCSPSSQLLLCIWAFDLPGPLLFQFSPLHLSKSCLSLKQMKMIILFCIHPHLEWHLHPMNCRSTKLSIMFTWQIFSGGSYFAIVLNSSLKIYFICIIFYSTFDLIMSCLPS